MTATKHRLFGAQPLIEEIVEDGVAEWIVGFKNDPTFGPVVVVGPGGTMAELFDSAQAADALMILQARQVSAPE